MKIEPVIPKILSKQLIPNVDQTLGKNLGLDLSRHTSIGIVTCDQDDALYVALDHATKFTEVDVVYAKSFYAGSNHQSGPFSGEVIGIIAGANSADVSEGLDEIVKSIQSEISFYQFSGIKGPSFFPHVISSVGEYISKSANVPLGSSMAYLIAPPAESIFALDQAMKSSVVKMVKYFGPPTETNFGGAYLSGELNDVLAAKEAFIAALYEFVNSPQGR